MEKQHDIGKYVAQKIDFIKDNKAVLSRLRKNVGKEPGSDPILWGILFDNALEFNPEAFAYGRPSKFEWAVHTTLTLYAIHILKMGQNAHQEGIDLGSAVAYLAENEEDIQKIWKKFSNRIASTEFHAIATQVRQIVCLLGSKKIGFDYVKLARQLYQWQFEGGPEQVRLAWGSGFFRPRKKENIAAS